MLHNNLLHYELSAVLLLTPHSCFAWSYKALAMLVDCMWELWVAVGGRGRGQSQGVQFV